MHFALMSDAIDDCRPDMLVLVPSDYRTTIEAIVSDAIGLGSMPGAPRSTNVAFDSLETPRGEIVVHCEPEFARAATGVETLLVALGYGVTREVGQA